MKINISDYVVTAINQEVKKLYLSFLYQLEDLKNDGKLNEEDFPYARKRILDRGNECIRTVENQLKNFDFTFKNLEDKGETL